MAGQDIYCEAGSYVWGFREGSKADGEREDRLPSSPPSSAAGELCAHVSKSVSLRAELSCALVHSELARYRSGVGLPSMPGVDG